MPVRIVVQRVARAAVTVDGRTVAGIDEGLCLFVGVAPDDGRREVEAAVQKIAGLRVFADEDGRLPRSVAEIGGEVLVVSQFTLLADARKGRRPSFAGAGPPGLAAALIAEMVDGFREQGIQVSEGVFGAMMSVDLVNDGPVTLVLDFREGAVA